MHKKISLKIRLKMLVFAFFLANSITISTMENKGSIQKTARRRLVTILNHIYPDKTIPGGMMNNLNSKHIYLFLLSAAILNSTNTHSMLNQSIIISKPLESIEIEKKIESLAKKQAAIKLRQANRKFLELSETILKQNSSDLDTTIHSMQLELNTIINLTKEACKNKNSERLRILESIKLTTEDIKSELILDWREKVEWANSISFTKTADAILEDSLIEVNNLAANGSHWAYSENLNAHLAFMQNKEWSIDISNYILQMLWWNEVKKEHKITNSPHATAIAFELRKRNSTLPSVSLKSYKKKSKVIKKQKPQFLPVFLDQKSIADISTFPCLLKKRILKHQLELHTKFLRNAEINKTIENYEEYLSLLELYKAAMLEAKLSKKSSNQKNSKAKTLIIEDTINQLRQKLESLKTQACLNFTTTLTLNDIRTNNEIPKLEDTTTTTTTTPELSSSSSPSFEDDNFWNEQNKDETSTSSNSSPTASSSDSMQTDLPEYNNYKQKIEDTLAAKNISYLEQMIDPREETEKIKEYIETLHTSIILLTSENTAPQYKNQINSLIQPKISSHLILVNRYKIDPRFKKQYRDQLTSCKAFLKKLHKKPQLQTKKYSNETNLKRLNDFDAQVAAKIEEITKKADLEKPKPVTTPIVTENNKQFGNLTPIETPEKEINSAMNTVTTEPSNVKNKTNYQQTFVNRIWSLFATVKSSVSWFCRLPFAYFR